MLFQRVLIRPFSPLDTCSSLRPVLFQRVLILKRQPRLLWRQFETRAISEGAHSRASYANAVSVFETRAISEGAHSMSNMWWINTLFETRAISEGAHSGWRR